MGEIIIFLRKYLEEYCFFLKNCQRIFKILTPRGNFCSFSYKRELRDPSTVRGVKLTFPSSRRKEGEVSKVCVCTIFSVSKLLALRHFSKKKKKRIFQIKKLTGKRLHFFHLAITIFTILSVYTK